MPNHGAGTLPELPTPTLPPWLEAALQRVPQVAQPRPRKPCAKQASPLSDRAAALLSAHADRSVQRIAAEVPCSPQLVDKVRRRMRRASA